MVKNTTGGSSHKRFARKNQGNTKGSDSWDKSDPLLLEVSVIKPLGDCRFQVQTKDRGPLICHVSNRYAGRYKHHNMVIANALLLVSLREYENPPKHCDYLQKISDTTPLDFFTVRSVREIQDLELDIFQKGRDLPLISEEDGKPLADSDVWDEGKQVGGDGDIDFDAI